MNEEDRKLLTEWLGEEWKTIENSWGDDFPCRNRTFTDPADFFAVRNRLVELGEWDDFERYVYYKQPISMTKGTHINIPWLTSTTDSGTYRLCELVVEWIKKREIKYA